MLKTMRDNLKSLHIILWAVIASFLLWFGLTITQSARSIGGGTMSHAVVATVDDLPVGVDEFRQSLENQRNLYRSLYKERYQEMAADLDLEKSVLDTLVGQKVALSEASSLGMKVTPEDVQQRILGMSSFQREGRFVGQDTYRRILEMNNISPRTFERMVEDELLFNRFRDILADSIVVGEEEVREEYRRRNEKAAIDYVLFVPAKFEERVPAGESALAAWYDQHPEEFRDPEKRRVRFLLVETRRLAQSIQPSEEDIRYYYEDNKEADFYLPDQVRASHILLKTDAQMTPEDKAAKRRLAEELLARARAGEDFAALARQHSEDSSAAQGGDLGFFGEGAMVKPFEDAAFALEEGGISDVVESRFGYHVIKQTGRRPAGYRPLEEVRERIAHQLQTDAAASQAPQAAEGLLERLRSGEATLDQLATPDGGGYPVREVTFGRDEGVPMFGKESGFAETAFSLEKAGDLAGPVVVPQGAAILSLAQVIEPRVPPLRDVRQRVEQAMRRERSLELARAAAERVRAELERGGRLPEIAAREGLELQSPEPFTRGGYVEGVGSTRPFEEAVFALQPGQAGPVASTEAGELAYVVRDRRVADEQSFTTERENLRTQLASSRQQQLLSAVLEELKKHKAVQLNPEYFSGEQKPQAQ